MYKFLIDIFRSVCVFWLFWHVGWPGVHAQSTTTAYTLEQCVDYAIRNHRNPRVERLELERSEAKIQEILSSGRPQVNGFADVNYNAILPTQLIPAAAFGGREGDFIPVRFGTDYSASLGLSANQLIFDAAYLLGVKAAREYVGLAKRNIRRSESETAAAVAKAYYAVLVNQQRFELLRTSRTQLAQLLETTQVQFKNGVVEEIDVNRLQVSLSNTDTDIEKTKSLIDLSLNLLRFQMGMPMTETLTIQSNAKIESWKKLALDTLQPMMTETRIEYDILEQNKRLAEMNVRRLRYGYYPNLVGFGTLQTQALRNEFNFFSTKEQWFAAAVIGVRLNVPIFDGLQKKAQIQQAKLDIDRIRLEENHFRQSVDFQYRNARTEMRNAAKTIEARQRTVELAQKVSNVAQIKYKEGIGTNIEVIQADTEFKMAQTNYLNALMEAYLAHVNLQESLGTLYVSK
jgi:outer membrane protein